MSKEKEETKPVNEKEVDLSNAGRGVWLVKVPKYIANKWEKAAGGTDVGKLTITKHSGRKAQISMTLPDAILNGENDEKIPKQHQLDLSMMNTQTLGVFSHAQRKFAYRYFFIFSLCFRNYFIVLLFPVIAR